MSSGKAIELFLVNGVPGGMTTATIGQWTGQLTACPRSALDELYKREESNLNGVYFLYGKTESTTERPWFYIGQAQCLRERLQTHSNKRKKQDQWQRVLIMICHDSSFNQACWAEVERRLITMAREIGRCVLDDNKQTPTANRLSEAQHAMVNKYLEELFVLLPVMGIDIFRSSAPEASAQAIEESSVSPIFHLRVPKRGIDAQMKVVNGDIYLLKGSHVIPRWTSVGNTEQTKRTYASLSRRHTDLLAEGLIDSGIVQHDVKCSSPSEAGGIAKGTTCRGTTEWVTDDGVTYSDWLNRSR